MLKCTMLIGLNIVNGIVKSNTSIKIYVPSCHCFFIEAAWLSIFFHLSVIPAHPHFSPHSILKKLRHGWRILKKFSLRIASVERGGSSLLALPLELPSSLPFLRLPCMRDIAPLNLSVTERFSYTIVSTVSPCRAVIHPCKQCQGTVVLVSL